MKPRIALAVIFASALAMLPTQVHATGGTKYAVVYDLGGRGDNAINDLAGAGVDLARKKLNLDQFALREAATDGTDLDRLTKIRTLANANYSVIILIGAGFDAALRQALVEFPTVQFVALDDPSIGAGQLNLTNIEFNGGQGAYLAGALAALNSKSGRIGIVGGGAAQASDFALGAKSINSKIKFAAAAANLDLSAVTAAMVRQGADVIYSLDATPASASVLLSLNTKKRPLKLIAHLPDGFFVKTAQYQPVLLGAVVDRVDIAVYNILAKANLDENYRDLIDPAQSIIGHRFDFQDGMDIVVTTLGRASVSTLLKHKALLIAGKVKIV